MNAHAETHRTHTTDEAHDTIRRLLVVRRDARLFGIYADAIEASGAIEDGTHGDTVGDTDGGTRGFGFSELFTPPAPLPGAPRAVRGVVVVRGRVYTLVDPALLIDERVDDAPPAASDDERPARPLVVTLRGDEQLAIEVERIEATIFITAANIVPASLPGIEGVARDIAAQDVYVLDTRALFAAATRGMERRRRRT